MTMMVVKMINGCGDQIILKVPSVYILAHKNPSPSFYDDYDNDHAYFDIEDIDVSSNRFAIDIDIDFGDYYKRIPTSCVYGK